MHLVLHCPIKQKLIGYWKLVCYIPEAIPSCTRQASSSKSHYVNNKYKTMWHLFFLLLTFFAVGLIILFGLKYVQDIKGFLFWENVGQFILRLFIGAVVAIVIALAVQYSWVIWTAMIVLAFLSNYWMAFLYKKKG